MTFDDALAERLRSELHGTPGLTEKKMFGGLAFLVNGNMCAGIVGDELMVRVGPEVYAAALARPYAREMDFTGRPLRGFVYVAPAGFRDRRALRAWLDRGLAFAASLPAAARAGRAAAKGRKRKA